MERNGCTTDSGAGTIPSVPPRTDSPSETGAFLTDRATLERVRDRAQAFLREAVDRAGADGVVVGMSGGVDSTTAAILAVEALGSDRVLGFSLPCTKIEGCHASDARTIAEGLGIEFREITLRPMLDLFESVVAPAVDTEPDRTARENVIARLRMCCLYYAANARSRLVLGTANRSERLLGYFTKYGDGGADLFPIGDLYKTEVRALAQHLGVPRRIVRKPPTPGFRAGETDEADLGADYATIDRLLARAVDGDEPIEEVVGDLDVDRDTAAELAARHEETAHKRSVPLTLELRA